MQGEGVEEAPEKLFLMTALLMWNGFVKLAHLWPHVSQDLAPPIGAPIVG